MTIGIRGAPAHLSQATAGETIFHEDLGSPRLRSVHNRTLIVTIRQLLYPITLDVLRQVFSPYGLLEKIEIIHNTFEVQALVQFKYSLDAITASRTLQGRNIYDDCCKLDIHLKGYGNEFTVAGDHEISIPPALSGEHLENLTDELTVPAAKIHDLTRTLVPTKAESLQIILFPKGKVSRTLLVTVHHMLFPITEEVLQQVFSPLGFVEKIEIIQKSSQFQALIQFRSLHTAVAVRNSLQGRYIYDGCCQLDIQFSSFNEPQYNDELSTNLIDAVETLVTVTPTKVIKAPKQVVQVLKLPLNQIKAYDEGLNANSKMNLHLQAKAGCVEEVTPDLIVNEQPLNAIIDACVPTDDIECEKSVDVFAAYLLFDKLRLWKSLDLFDLVKVKVQRSKLLPNCDRMAAISSVTSDGIEASIGASVEMKFSMVLFDPGGNTLPTFKENMMSFLINCSPKLPLVFVIKLPSQSAYDVGGNVARINVKDLLNENGFQASKFLIKARHQKILNKKVTREWLVDLLRDTLNSGVGTENLESKNINILKLKGAGYVCLKEIRSDEVQCYFGAVFAYNLKTNFHSLLLGDGAVCLGVENEQLIDQSN